MAVGPEEHKTLFEWLYYAGAMVGGALGLRGMQRFSNGGENKIVDAIREEGDKTRKLLHQLVDRMVELRDDMRAEHTATRSTVVAESRTLERVIREP